MVHLVVSQLSFSIRHEEERSLVSNVLVNKQLEAGKYNRISAPVHRVSASSFLSPLAHCWELTWQPVLGAPPIGAAPQLSASCLGVMSDGMEMSNTCPTQWICPTPLHFCLTSDLHHCITVIYKVTPKYSSELGDTRTVPHAEAAAAMSGLQYRFPTRGNLGCCVLAVPCYVLLSIHAWPGSRYTDRARHC